MATPTAAYSIRLRVRLDNRPGTLGRLATSIGDAGGNITAIGGFDVRSAHLDEDVPVNCSSEAHIERVTAAVRGADGAEGLETADGTAVLGLGDIGPAGALPVMEGKALLFKSFAGVDAFPICLDVTTPDEIVETVVRIAPVFGGINLEDIAAPACFEIEDRLKELLDI